jgi:predicted DNA-binding protein
MKTAISVPDATFERVDAAASRLGVSRSQFYARAAERWLAELDDDGTTAAINRALEEIGDEDENREFLAEAAYRTAQRTEW